jgi:hypothetical protein
MPKSRKGAVDLFTSDEHAVLAKWFGVEPPGCAAGINAEDAAGRLGFVERPGFYTLIDAAAAHVVLEKVEDRLPQWALVAVEGGSNILLARGYRDSAQILDRKVLLAPRYLFTINWADSGPGYSWPVAYYVTWLPYYDRFVITASADSPEAFGYCDFALGEFGVDTPLSEGTKRIICRDWANQHNKYEQERWAYLFGIGLVSKAEADRWADEVWPSHSNDEEIEDDDC